ncbi:MAG: hypothetical protein M3Z02_07840 [Actinomycetota bacterium]|nr:hypothetical protein [Actinomycetota bacterium]
MTAPYWHVRSPLSATLLAAVVVALAGCQSGSPNGANREPAGPVGQATPVYVGSVPTAVPPLGDSPSK